MLQHPADLLDLHALDPDRYPFLLQSCSGAAGPGRFDILFAFPGKRLTLGSDLALEGGLPEHAVGGGGRSTDFLAAFDAWWAAESRPATTPSRPFTGGWFVFLAYEMAQQVERSVPMTADRDFPVATAVRIPAAVIHDRATGQRVAIAEPGHADLLPQIVADAERAARFPRGGGGCTSGAAASGDVEEDDPQRFLLAVERAQDYIARGDVYQVNLSRRWRGAFPAAMPSWKIYESLRATNPAPFAGLALLGTTSIVSSSPERLVEVRGRHVQTRPIAGTRPRLPREIEAERRAELVAHPKERAEHVMLIDLERNDLGRVCLPGTVHVSEFMTVESYAHVHHIVSNVAGELLPGSTPGAVLRAVFPGGTITGCPKVRCMAIIREIEDRPRGPYTGSMGYVNLDGSGDFNILIRTIAMKDRRWRLDAGSGIVADSRPQRELDETRAKAKGMLMALGSAGG